MQTEKLKMQSTMREVRSSMDAHMDSNDALVSFSTESENKMVVLIVETLGRVRSHVVGTQIFDAYPFSGELRLNPWSNKLMTREVTGILVPLARFAEISFDGTVETEDPVHLG